MNRLGTIAGGFVRTVGAAFTWAGGKVAGSISLTNSWLAHLLWLIEATFRELGTKAYEGNAAVYACLRFLCAAVAEPPLVAYLRQPDGTPAKDPLDWNHPLRQLIRKPNPFLTEMEHYELITLHLGIAGRYTGWKERNNLGQVKAVWPLRPDRVGPIYGDAAAGEDLLIGWSYQVPGTTIYVGIPHDDIVLINIPDPVGESGGMVEGFGPLQALANEIGADNAATMFVGALVANYAQPGIVIQTKGGIQTEEDQRLIKQGFKRDFGGAKRGEPAVIDNDTTVTQIGFSLQQLEFKSLRDVSESRIASALGIPAVLVGLLVGLNAAIKATTDELRALFAETTLPVYWRRYAEAFTNDLAIEFGDEIILVFDLTKVAALSEQSDQLFARYMAAYQNNAMTKDEFRDKIGLDPLPAGGDVYMNGLKPGEQPAAPTDPFGLSPLPADDKPTNGKSNAQGPTNGKVDPTASTKDANGSKPSGNPVTAASPADKEKLKAARAAVLDTPQDESARGYDLMESGLVELLSFWNKKHTEDDAGT